jgi:hypothetical protein
MIVLVLVSLIAFVIWRVHSYARNARRRLEARDTEPGHPDPAAEPIGWTALDDQQLKRLLEDSPPDI